MQWCSPVGMAFPYDFGQGERVSTYTKPGVLNLFLTIAPFHCFLKQSPTTVPIWKNIYKKDNLLTLFN